MLMKKPHFLIETPFFSSLSSLFINACAMLSSFCSPCSIAVDRGVLFTNNSFIVFDGKVVGFRLATNLDAVTLPFLYKKKLVRFWTLKLCFLFNKVYFIFSEVKFSL